MRVHHRIPSIFTLSMVDVLCCALGCVILLWLINLKDAKNHEDKLAETSDLLTLTRTARDALEKEKADVIQQRDNLVLSMQQLDQKLKDANQRIVTLSGDVQVRSQSIASLTAQATELNRKLEAASKRADTLQVQADLVPGLRSDVKTLQAQADLLPGLRADLKTLQAQADLLPGLRSDLKAMQAQADLLPGLRADLKATREKLTAEEARLREQVQAMADASKSMETVRNARAVLEREVETKDKELALLRPYKERLAASELKVGTLEKLMTERGKDLTLANQGLETLREEKNLWQKEAQRARAAIDNRFAGITLTGKRVIFLVDMSGSMELVDEKTPAPNKWAEVAATVVKVMRSLPDLQKFQVIVFSEKASYLLGGENQWFDYDARTSADRVLQALNQIKPTGGTNMYDALAGAFRFREAGLDTVYLLSDGLPNMGAGVPDEVARTLKEIDLSERLGKHIRKTLNTEWNTKNRDQPRVRINTIGFFYESPDVGAFLWALARENEGSFVGMSKP